MSVSQRTFTKDFEEGAVRRFELGASVAEMALTYPRIQNELSPASLIPIRLMRRWRWMLAWDLHDQIPRIALELPCYDWRPVAAKFRRGWTVNHKRVARSW